MSFVKLLFGIVHLISGVVHFMSSLVVESIWSSGVVFCLKSLTFSMLRLVKPWVRSLHKPSILRNNIILVIRISLKPLPCVMSTFLFQVITLVSTLRVKGILLLLPLTWPYNLRRLTNLMVMSMLILGLERLSGGVKEDVILAWWTSVWIMRRNIVGVTFSIF